MYSFCIMIFVLYIEKLSSVFCVTGLGYEQDEP